MAVIKAFAGALGGTFADLWRDIITAGPFTEHTVVVPGIPRGSNNDRGSNEYGSEGNNHQWFAYLCAREYCGVHFL